MPGAALRGFGRAYLNGGGAAWTRKEGKSESGGLNERVVNLTREKTLDQI